MVKYVPEKHVAVKGVSVILKFVLDGSSVRYYRSQHDIKVIFVARPPVDPIKCWNFGIMISGTDQGFEDGAFLTTYNRLWTTDV